MIVSRAAQAWDASSNVGLPLRVAQRAFAALIEGGNRGEFATAQLRSTARRTLSALSADEQSNLSRWLSLQLATNFVDNRVGTSSALTRVDAILAAGISAMLRRTREELLVPAHEGIAVA